VRTAPPGLRPGSFAVPAAAALDAGLFMTAANGWTGTRGAVEFDGFVVS